MQLESEQFFNRVCEALELDNVYGVKSKIAKKVGVSKTAVGFWDNGSVPGAEALKNLIKVSELSNTSLHWLLTGEGEKFINQPKQTSFDDLLEQKMREIAREEITKQLNKDKKDKSRPSLSLNLAEPDEGRKAA